MFKACIVILFGLMAIALSIVNLQSGMFLQGIYASGSVVVRYALPIAFLAFLIGQAEVLVQSLNIAEIGRHLETKYGLLAVWIAGVVSPGSPPMLPLISALWEKDTGRFGVIAFLMLVPMLNLETVLIRLPLLGWNLTIIAYLFGILFSLVMIILLIIARVFISR